MIQTIKISAALQRQHKGQVAIYLNGNPIAFGNNTLKAVSNAKKIIPNIEDQNFVISRVHHDYLAV